MVTIKYCIRLPYAEIVIKISSIKFYGSHCLFNTFYFSEKIPGLVIIISGGKKPEKNAAVTVLSEWRLEGLG